eukprot:4989200-Lingulodinium_polyedra.AAC.1
MNEHCLSKVEADAGTSTETFHGCAYCAERVHPNNPPYAQNGKLTAWYKRRAERSRATSTSTRTRTSCATWSSRR